MSIKKNNTYFKENDGKVYYFDENGVSSIVPNSAFGTLKDELESTSAELADTIETTSGILHGEIDTASCNLQEQIDNIGSPLTYSGAKTVDEINAITSTKQGTVYTISDSGTITGLNSDIQVNKSDEIAYAVNQGWVKIGKDFLYSDYYKKTETSGAQEIQNALNLKQNTLTPGKNISINDYVIDIKNNECSADATSIAFGNKSQASGEYSLCYGSVNEGKPNIASGKCCINLGWDSSAIGNCSVIIGGYSCLASSDNDKYGPVAQGLRTSAFGYYSHAEGQDTIAAGDYTHTEGASTYAESASHAEGQLTSAYGQNSHTEGLYNFTSANYSHTEGVYTQTLGQGSHAEGLSSVAKGKCSHAEGHATSAFGSRSHSEGHETIASGSRSHSEGSGTSAVGSASHTEGIGTIAGDDYMHVGGKFNKTSSDALFVIGNGTDNEHRSDAFIISADGTVSAKRFIEADPALTITGGDYVFVTEDSTNNKLVIDIDSDLGTMLTSLSGLLSAGALPTTGRHILGVDNGTLTWLEVNQ